VYIVSTAHVPITRVGTLDVLKVLLSSTLALYSWPRVEPSFTSSLDGQGCPLLQAALRALTAGTFAKPVTSLAFVHIGTSIVEAMDSMMRHSPPLTALPVAVRALCSYALNHPSLSTPPPSTPRVHVAT
jgi:hypothetical protein